MWVESSLFDWTYPSPACDHGRHGAGARGGRLGRRGPARGHLGAGHLPLRLVQEGPLHLQLTPDTAVTQDIKRMEGEVDT